MSCRLAGRTPILDGIGHGLDLSNPDYTYSNDPNYQGNDPIVLRNNWAVRPVRTLEMEKEVFSEMHGKYGNGSIAFSDIEGTLKEFNAIRENGSGTKDFAQKIAVLQRKIDEWGLKDGTGESLKLVDPKSGGYNRRTGDKNRNRNLCIDGQRLRQEDYPGTILPKSDAPC
ncbi:MAG TPA: hypothetical protein VJN66_06335 [Rhodanobacteraceae bacterium]|nr:hypothetical protein [Rhodanobacteraceae bacterium]